MRLYNRDEKYNTYKRGSYYQPRLYSFFRVPSLPPSCALYSVTLICRSFFFFFLPRSTHSPSHGFLGLENLHGGGTGVVVVVHGMEFPGVCEDVGG